MRMKSALICSFLLASTYAARVSAADNDAVDRTVSYLTMAPISDITDGYFGSKRLFFSLACNERFTQLLTQAESQSTLAVGILIERLDYTCNQPDREIFTRVTPNGRALHPVVTFSEVWFCSAMCYTGGGAPNGMPPYQYVSAFGTSERQATSNLACGSAYLINLRCGLQDVH